MWLLYVATYSFSIICCHWHCHLCILHRLCGTTEADDWVCVRLQTVFCCHLVLHRGTSGVVAFLLKTAQTIRYMCCTYCCRTQSDADHCALYSWCTEAVFRQKVDLRRFSGKDLELLFNVFAFDFISSPGGYLALITGVLALQIHNRFQTQGGSELCRGW